jgi:hypothetical protein
MRSVDRSARTSHRVRPATRATSGWARRLSGSPRTVTCPKESLGLICLGLPRCGFRPPRRAYVARPGTTPPSRGTPGGDPMAPMPASTRPGCRVVTLNIRHCHCCVRSVSGRERGVMESAPAFGKIRGRRRTCLEQDGMRGLFPRCPTVWLLICAILGNTANTPLLAHSRQPAQAGSAE